MKHKRTVYKSKQAYYRYRGENQEPDFSFSGALSSPQERLNLIALILRDYADTMHNKVSKRESEAECRALAAWVDELCRTYIRNHQ